MNLSLKQKIDSQIEHSLVVAKGKGLGGRMDWELEIIRCKLLYRMNNKVLLHITGNCIPQHYNKP